MENAQGVVLASPLLANVGRTPVLQVKVEVSAMHVVGLWTQHGREDVAGPLNRQTQKLGVGGVRLI